MQSKKRTEVLESLLGLVSSYSNHFHEGQDYFQDLDVFTQQLAIEIDALKTKTDTLDKQLEKRHNCVSDLDQSAIRIEGKILDTNPKYRSRQYCESKTLHKTEVT